MDRHLSVVLDLAPHRRVVAQDGRAAGEEFIDDADMGHPPLEGVGHGRANQLLDARQVQPLLDLNSGPRLSAVLLVESLAVAVDGGGTQSELLSDDALIMHAVPPQGRNLGPPLQDFTL